MSGKLKVLLVIVSAGLLLLMLPKVQFVLGGTLINLGYRFQDHIDESDFKAIEEMGASELLDMVITQNKKASGVRKLFPRTVHHPKIAIMACMDARIDTNELMGDTRQLYYVLRSAGSILTSVQQEMLELAVVNGVKVLVLTTHTDCAAEKVANDPKLSLQFPGLASEVHLRAKKMQEFLNRPIIAKKIANNELKVVDAKIDTENSELIFHTQ